MYDWRQLTDDQRRELVEWRQSHRVPWHSPPHGVLDRPFYHLSAACYEHRPYAGTSVARLAGLESTLLKTLHSHDRGVLAWCVLPNHYHALVRTSQLRTALREIGRMHGRLAFEWNGEDGQRGRKLWCGCSDRAIRSERHFWATMNYIHHNPVRHGYVKRWQDWPLSSAAGFLERMGKRKATEIWERYPVLD